jgi:hypothetical protein
MSIRIIVDHCTSKILYISEGNNQKKDYMKNLCFILMFFNFTIGEAYHQPTLIENIQSQIYLCDRMIEDEPWKEEYWRGQKDAFVMVFNHITLEYRDHR